MKKKSIALITKRERTMLESTLLERIGTAIFYFFAGLIFLCFGTLILGALLYAILMGLPVLIDAFQQAFS